MRTYIYIIGLVVAMAIVASCTQKPQTVETVSEWIEISKEQFVNDGMQTGFPQKMLFEYTVNANATVVATPNGMAKIHTAVSGTVKNIHCRSGEYVSKNQVLLELSGNEVYDLQKDYVESSAAYRRMKNEYERVKVLFDEKVVSEKEFTVSESEYRIAMARYQALKLKVETAGFSVSEIEAGRFYSTYKLRSPINGQITQLNTSVAAFVDPQTELIEIVNPQMLQLRLSVFASDIPKLKTGQTVRVANGNPDSVHLAIIQSVGVAVDEQTKTVECFAALNSKQPGLMANEFLACDIVVGQDSVVAIPSEAVMKTETGQVLLKLKKQENDVFYFEKLDVKVGRTYNGFTELLDIDQSEPVLTKAVYNIVL
ncbi:MAG: efflux RND transporter periplasmic adaptor subunit [Paludibacter sp.]|nr:efflux RND transporter periplasmic adaptor subunit [Paludibacter sp.]